MAFVAADFGEAHAEITSVAGPASTLGTPPGIAPASSDLLDSCVTGNGQIGFDEAQGVVTPLAFQADDGVILPKETLVDSHMIVFHPAAATTARHQDVVWTFKHPILAVMSSEDGGLEAASTFALGARKPSASGATAPSAARCTGAAPVGAHGLASTDSTAPYKHTACPSDDDCYTVAGNTLKVSMGASQPGTWIRVITQGALKVAIDIQPGGGAGCVSSRGGIPVAILGSAAFDAAQIDQASLSLEGLSVRVKSNGKRQCAVSDTNNDGFEDLVCQFREDAKAWHGTRGPASVTGSLLDGDLFEGADSICVAP